MNVKILHRLVLFAAASLVAGLSCPQRGFATVASGWDLFITSSDTTFMGANYQGVPLGTYDFGSGVAINVDGTDTIVQRVAGATPGTFNIYFRALQLRSVLPIFGSDYGYITLNSTLSSGTVVIDEVLGTFENHFTINYDLWQGLPGGTLYTSGSLNLGGTGNWSHDAPPGVFTISGINYELKAPGVTTEDFWPLGSLNHVDESDPGSGHMHKVTSTPEPSTILAGAFAGLALVCHLRRMRR